MKLSHRLFAVAAALLVLAAPAFAAQRIVHVEHFTAAW